MKTESVLEKVFATGELAVTGECGPPRGALPDVVKNKAAMLKGYVDAVNVTDNQTAMVRMSSFAASVFLRQMDLHPVFQMVTRDRNRLAMQSDILGAYSHGINTMLCLSGDHTQFGDHAMAANVHDLDSVQLIQTVRECEMKVGSREGRKSRTHLKCLSVRPPTPLPIRLNCGLPGWPKK